MALDIGELVGRLLLDPSDYDKGLEDAPKKAERAGARIGKAMAVAGAAGGAALSVGLVQSITAEPARDKLNAQLGLTGKDAAQAGKVAASLYRNNFGADLGQVNEAIKAVVQNMNQQINGADFKPLTAQVISLADTFDQDLNGVTAAAGQLLKTGLAPTAQAALDIVAKGFQSGVDKSGDFLDTLNEYGTQFRALGIDGATATGLLRQGLQGGARDADLVADSLKEFNLRAQAGASGTTQAFKDLGLNGKAMADTIAHGGPAATAALQSTLDKLRAVKDPADQSRIAVALFGSQSEDMQRALLNLDPSKAVTDLGKFQGAAQGVADTVGDNTQGKIETYRRKLLGIGQDAVESAGPLAAVAGAAAAFGPAVLSTLAPIAQLVAARAASTAAATAAAAAEVEVGAASTLALGPIGLIVIAVAALVVGLVYAWKHCETFRDVVKAVFKAVAGFVLGAIDLWLGAYEKLFRAMSHIPGIGGQFKKVADAIGGVRSKVDDLKTSIEGIPTHKFVDIIVRTPTPKELAGAGGTKGLTIEGARAGGGPVSAGLSYLVGEREPEVFVPAQNGRIYNQQQIAAALSGASGGAAAPGPVRLHPDDLRALRTGTRDLHFHTTGLSGREMVDEAVFASRSGGLD